jgi:2-amino-4-hydroxy-6-hydroxymethyldihydropteridine diphosphokinase
LKIVCFLGLGSNLGDRYGYLLEAAKRICSIEGIFCTGISDLYETEPVGYVEQDKFLNMVMKIETTLGPFELLDALLNIEKSLGRERLIRWGPRTIDLDILAYGTIEMESDRLVVPHPRMHERAFVLKPFMDIERKWIHPVLGVDIETLWHRLPKESGGTICSMGLANEFARIVSSNI